MNKEIVKLGNIVATKYRGILEVIKNGKRIVRIRTTGTAKQFIKQNRQAIKKVAN